MAKIKISKNLIISIASQDNEVYLERTQNLIRNIISASVEQLSERVSYVTANNVVLQPVNELLSGAFCDNSQFVYFLGVENAQLEINTSKKTNFWTNLWQKVKFAWKNRKKKTRKKKKNKEIDVAEASIKQVDITKYSIYDLTKDLQTMTANQLTETSLVYLNGNQLYILGKDDFGANVKIKIYVVNYNNEFFRFYAGKRKGFIDVNINARCEALNAKLKATGDNFIKILKILNILYYNANGNIPNQVFIESVLCSVPDKLFEGDDIYSVFVKIINYLSIKTIKGITSINNEKQTIFEDVVCGNEAYGFTKLMEYVSEHE